MIPSLADAHGGPSRAARLMEAALASRGIEVELATTDDAGARARNGKPLGVLLVEEGASRRYFRRDTLRYKVSLSFARWILRHVRDYDLIHIHALFSFTSGVAAIAARRARVPYVIRPLGTLGHYGMTQRRPFLKRASIAWLEAPLLRAAAAIHFTSEQERREAEALGIPMRAVTVPLAVEPLADPGPDGFPAALSSLRDKRYGLFVSRLDPKKNVEGLLGAIRRCVDAAPDTLWLIAGDGESGYVAQLHAHAARLGLAQHVVWAGHIDGSVKAAVMSRASVFVLASHSENFGIAAAEAASAGIPCVLGRGVAICGELVEAGAALEVGTDPASIADAVLRILGDPALRTAMANGARRHAAENYSPAAMGAALERLYRDVLVTANSGARH